MYEDDWNEEDLSWIKDQEDMQNDADRLGITDDNFADDDFNEDWDEDDWDEEEDWDYFDEEDDYEDSEEIADEFLSLMENKKRKKISPLIQEAFNIHRQK